MEAILTRQDPTSLSSGQAFDFVNAKPIDIISPYQQTYGSFVSVRGIAVPYLQLERAQYRFGVRQNSSKTFTMRGDSIYYCQSTPYYQRFTPAGVGPYAFAHTAIKTVEQGSNVYAYCVTVHYSDGSYKRLVHGDDYTDTNANFTLNSASSVSGAAAIDIVYASATSITVNQAAHPSTSVKPAAVRGRDVDFVVSDGAATPTYTVWKGVQTAEASWAVTLEADEELGNPHYVARDYDTPQVSGQVVLRPADPKALTDKIAHISGVTAADGGDTINTISQIPVGVEIRVSHPDTGARLQTIYIPDARFSPPAVQPRVGQKLDVTLTFSSDTGSMRVYEGARP